MKKLFVLIMTVMLLMSASITVFASETITVQKGSKAVDVQAKAVYTLPENMCIAKVTNGKAEIVMADGKKITVSAEDGILDGLTLNIIEIVKEDSKAYSWISDILNGIADKFVAYDIYFTDKTGNKVQIFENVTVTITTPDGFENPKVFNITTDAKTEQIDSKQANDSTEFVTNSFSYYVIYDKTVNDVGITEPSTPSNPADITNPTASNSPQTDDSRNMAIWIYLLILSGGVATALGISKKRRKEIK